ncbi:MAG: ABC transporter ATP-binding protein [Polyangiaceae bacterium]|jgi:ATP-binding cassette subfamily B protein
MSATIAPPLAHGKATPSPVDGGAPRHLLIRSLRMLAPVRGLAVATIGVLVIATLLGLAGPAILRYAIDRGLGTGQPDLRVLRNAGALFLAVALASLGLGRLHTRMLAALGEHFVRDVRTRVFRHVTAMPVRYFDRTPSGRLVSRMTSDVDALQDLVQLGLTQFVQSVLTLGVLLALLAALSWRLTLVCMVPMLGFFAVLGLFQKRSRPAYLALRERVAHTLALFLESLAGVRVVQAFCQESTVTGRFSVANGRLCDASVAAAVVQATLLPAVELTTVLSNVLALGGGGFFVLEGRETLGTVSAFSLYLLMAFEPVQSLSALFNTLQSASAALEKILAILDEPLELTEGPVELEPRQAISLHHVRFAYGPDGPPVLSDVSLTLAHGEKIALVGETGAGKSTLARLIARIDDPTGGQVCYGGVDLRLATFRSLRRRIVMMAQEGHVFDGTVADNLRAVHPRATEDELCAALRRVGAAERFGALPASLYASVGARGARLSSGERQLLALARVALLDADVLVFDEATSSLDTRTELDVHQAMNALMRDRTIVIVAHRLSTIERVDRIALVADGRIAELGSHAELMARGERYAALYREWSHLRTDGDGCPSRMVAG